MKVLRPHGWLPLELLVVGFLATSDSSVSAMPPLSRQAVGEVVAIESANKRFTWRQTETRQEFQVTWNRRTTFFHNGQRTLAALQPGQQIRVSYRTPFFGPPYTNRVVILSSHLTKILKK